MSQRLGREHLIVVLPVVLEHLIARRIEYRDPVDALIASLGRRHCQFGRCSTGRQFDIRRQRTIGDDSVDTGVEEHEHRSVRSRSDVLDRIPGTKILIDDHVSIGLDAQQTLAACEPAGRSRAGSEVGQSSDGIIDLQCHTQHTVGAISLPIASKQHGAVGVHHLNRAIGVGAEDPIATEWAQNDGIGSGVDDDLWIWRGTDPSQRLVLCGKDPGDAVAIDQ